VTDTATERRIGKQISDCPLRIGHEHSTVMPPFSHEAPRETFGSDVVNEI
jgi:hypothetical protein